MNQPELERPKRPILEPQNEQPTPAQQEEPKPQRKEQVQQRLQVLDVSQSVARLLTDCPHCQATVIVQYLPQEPLSRPEKLICPKCQGRVIEVIARIKSTIAV